MITMLPLSAQEQGLAVFQHIAKEKFGTDVVYHQQWDNRGGIWMGTENGLIYYNGYTTRKWAHSPADSSGILSNNIQNIYLDSRGELWIGYADKAGISRMDIAAEKIKHYYPDTSSSDAYRRNTLPDAKVIFFIEDSKSRFWLLTWGGGLVKMDREKESFVNYRNPGKGEAYGKIIPNNIIKGFAESADGRFLLGFFEEGKTNARPAWFNPDTESFEVFPINDYFAGVDEVEKNEILAALTITNFIHIDKEKNFWFGTYSSLIFTDAKNKTSARVSAQKGEQRGQNLDNARQFVFDERGRMWVGTLNSGIMLVDVLTREVKMIRHQSAIETSLSDNRIITLRKDPSGNIWVSTRLGGCSVYNPMLQQFSLMSWEDMQLDYSDRSKQIVPVNQMFVRSNGRVDVSSERGISVVDPQLRKVISQINPKDFHYASHDTMTASRIRNFKWLGGGKMLLVSPSVPLMYDTSSGIAVRPAMPRPSKVQLDRSKILFRHSSKRDRLFIYENYMRPVPHVYLMEYDTINHRLVSFDSIVSVQIDERYSFELPDKRWMISLSERSFLVYDPATKKREVYSAQSKEYYFPDSTINIAYLDPDNTVWIGTKNGLYTFDYRNSKFTSFAGEPGLGKISVNAIIRDKDGIYWLALNEKVLKWDRARKRTWLFGRELGIAVGSFLPSIAQMDNEGRIYIASINGIISFNPKLIQPEISPTKIFLSSLVVRDDTLNEKRRNELLAGTTIFASSENSFVFEFHSSEVYSPVPLHFYYRLSGDSLWLDNGISNRVRLSNLPHGNYVLEVKAVNAYSTESDVLKIIFSVSKPFWLRWWFILLAVCGLILLVVLVIRYRERAHRKQTEILENKIAERTAEVVANAEKIRFQKEIIETKNKELTDSIHYARRIQRSILPEKTTLEKILPQHFIFYNPKDIVSGDFYWCSHLQDEIIWAVADCTGHGVPGGFMSMLGSGLLSQIVNEEKITDPATILGELRKRVIIALKQKGNFGESSDGMDAAVCRIRKATQQVEYAGANIPLYVFRNNELMDIRPDKQPIGIYAGEEKPFRTQVHQLQENDMIYLSSDGFADQFGGPKGKKLKTSGFLEILRKAQQMGIAEQEEFIRQSFVEWKGDFEQLDDICVMGVRADKTLLKN